MTDFVRLAVRIAMIGSRGIGTSYGGIERVLDSLCPELAALGHTVDVYASKSSPDCDIPGVQVIGAPCINGKHTETITRSIASLTKAIGRYDLIHFHAIGPGILSSATWLLGQPSVVTVHGLDQRRDKWGGFAKTCLSLAERTIVASADRVTVVSEELRRYFVERHDLRTSFVPNGVPVVTRAPRGRLLEGVGLSNRRYVFFASRLTPEKGCHDLIRAHAMLDDDTALVIAGKGIQPEYEAYLRGLAGPRVIFVGHRSGSELQELYSNADLFVLPSYIEGMSIALLEAVAYGLPTAVSDIPENISVVGEAAIRFRPRDVLAIAGALKTALQSRPGSAVGRVKWPTWAEVARSYSQVYGQAMKTRLQLCGEPSGTMG